MGTVKKKVYKNDPREIGASQLFFDLFIYFNLVLTCSFIFYLIHDIGVPTLRVFLA